MKEMIERQTSGPQNGRDEAQRDRARIIHSASFRRLQTKTQILGVGENDFYRTRLTHSLEVAQIGSGIVGVLEGQKDLDEEIRAVLPSLFQIEAICLGHDLGHPPFGHGGEIALNHHMKAHGGFEGNGQTLRIVSKLGEYSSQHGMNLMRRTMLGLLKYPALHKNLKNYPLSAPSETKPSWETQNIKKISKPPKCIHDEEADLLTWITTPFNKKDRELFLFFESHGKKHLETKHKSFDASIMELADDIAYGIHDFEDAVALGLITKKRWDKFVEAYIEKNEEFEISAFEQIEDFDIKQVFSEKSYLRKKQIGTLVHYFASSVHVKTIGGFEHPLLKFNATLNNDTENILKFFKKLVYEIVIESPEVQTLEFKGQQIVRRLYETLSDDPKRFLPNSTFLRTKSESTERVISDYISGMSDAYATKLYQKLFSPSIGSIFDKL